MEIQNIKVVRNPSRKGGDDEFKNPRYKCQFCDDYHSVLACMPTRDYEYEYICKTCLCKLVSAIDKNYQENFQKDFIEQRGDLHGTKI